MKRSVWVWVSVFSFMACTSLKEADESPEIGGAGDKSYAGAGRGGGQQPGAAGRAQAGTAGGSDGGGHDLGGDGANAAGSPTGGAGDGGITMGGAGDGGAGGGGGDELPLGDCASAVATTGQTYYFCDCAPGADADCKPGSNTALGTDPEQPLITYEDARTAFEQLKPGDAVAFCRGGVWTPDSNRRWSNSNNCTSEQPCTIRDYVASWDKDASAGPPRINADSGLGFHLFMGTGLQLLNFELNGTNQGLSVEKGVSDALLCGLTLDGFDRGAVLSDGGGTTNRIKLVDSIIRNSTGSALTMSSPCKDCVIAGNVFEQNGVGTYSDTIAIGGDDPARYEIRKNVFRTHSEPDKRLCLAASITILGDAADNALIEGNLIEDVSTDQAKGPGCGRIIFNGEELDRVVGTKIRKNRFNNVGESAVYAYYANDCVFENNVFSRTVTVHDADDNPLHFSPIVSNGSMDGLIIRNNTFFAAEGVVTASSAIVGMHQATKYPGFVAANNLVLFRATTPEFFFLMPPNDRAFEFVDNNLCFYPNAGQNGFWTPGNTLAEWSQGAEKFDQHSLNKDPKLDEEPGDTFLHPLSAQSPVVGAGAENRAPADDIEDKPRTPSAPDIGAIEH